MFSTFCREVQQITFVGCLLQILQVQSLSRLIQLIQTNPALRKELYVSRLNVIERSCYNMQILLVSRIDDSKIGSV